MTTKEALVIVSEADYMRDDWQAALAVLAALAEENAALKEELESYKRREKRLSDEAWAEGRDKT